MANIIKATVYITNFDEREANDVKMELEQALEPLSISTQLALSISIPELETSEAFIFEDDLKINFTDAAIEDYEKYFNKNDH